MNKEIVIAKYKENLNYLNQINNAKITIYNKDELDKNDNYISLKNIGRESHTFLYHIVNNYYNLADLTCFIQGDPFYHCYNTIDLINNSYKYTLLCNDLVNEHNTYKYNMVSYKVWNVFNSQYEHPTELIFAPGAQYMVTKDQILYHSKKIYEELLLMHNENIEIVLDLRNGSFKNEMPWVMERYWKYLWESYFYDKN